MTGIFNRSIFNNAIFNTDTSVVTTILDGGWGVADYRRYRRKLEKVIKASETYNQSKYINQAVAVAEITEDLALESPVIEQIAQAVQDDIIPQIDFTLLQAELNRVIQYLDTAITQKIERIRAQELDDETALLMMI